MWTSMFAKVHIYIPIVMSVYYFAIGLKAPMKGKSTKAKNTCSTEVDDGLTKLVIPLQIRQLRQ
jgi:hypothetical protein